ncbi:MAG: hypothetical protein K0R38_1568 [Polyangiaceae bacterium]|jgi:hypothetical protein|nr:hypothetical protein [Polyangiaceae bacterium]
MGRPPFDERELTVLFSALLLAGATVYFRREVRRVPKWHYLFAGLAFLVAGSSATIAEHFWAYDTFNTVEHACYMAQSVALLLWALKVRQVPAQ